MRPEQRAIAIEANRCSNCPAQFTREQISMWPMAAQDEYCASGLCRKCQAVVFAEDQTVCTCGSPCCEVDVGVGVITCAGMHCPVHGSA